MTERVIDALLTHERCRRLLQDYVLTDTAENLSLWGDTHQTEWPAELRAATAFIRETELLHHVVGVNNRVGSVVLSENLIRHFNRLGVVSPNQGAQLYLPGWRRA